MRVIHISDGETALSEESVLLHDITFGGELRKAALYVADRKILFYLIEGERFTVSSFEKQDLPKEEAGLDRTLSLIDTFLSSLPEEPVVMELPMDVTTDYTSFYCMRKNMCLMIYLR